jgi:2-succinyl-5-enolpyruvyl-6-hydroxy-3-cyclohexene-1-carboxylate synthase
VVVNNDGGAIFGLVEPGSERHAEAFERVFGTPHGVDFAAWCGATQTPHTRTASIGAALDAALDPRGGLHVVEVRTERASIRPLREALAREVASAVSQ